MQILQIKAPVFWEAMVAHAMECDLSDEPCLRSYKVEGKKILLFFNCVDGLVGVEFGDKFIATDMFDSKQKVQTLISASIGFTALIVVN
jgi:hypothetical protein